MELESFEAEILLCSGHDDISDVRVKSLQEEKEMSGCRLSAAGATNSQPMPAAQVQINNDVGGWM
jgi:hypothetical protein